MNSKQQVEDRLDGLGQFLRERPSVAADVIAQLDAQPPQSLEQAQPRPGRPRPVRIILTVAVSAVAAAIAVAVVLWPATANVSLAQVAAAARAQPWIRGRATLPHEKVHAEIWMSHEHRVWALKIGRDIQFTAGREGAMYRYHGGKTLTKYPATDEWERQQSPYRAMSQVADNLGPWLFGIETISQQERREVQEGGKTWIDYHLVVLRSRRILRVDPATRLPVFMRIAPDQPGEAAIEYVFDYPAEGPRDVYALGVPRDVRLIDLMPGPEAARMIDGMSGSRRAIGDFKMFVVEGSDLRVVWRKGDRWRIEHGTAGTSTRVPSRQRARPGTGGGTS